MSKNSLDDDLVFDEPVLQEVEIEKDPPKPVKRKKKAPDAVALDPPPVETKPAEDMFPMPETNIPPPEPANQEIPDWASETPGSPEFPVMTTQGWCGGGLLKFSLCERCTRYNSKTELCEGPAPESWRSHAKACINFRPRDSVRL